MIGVVRYIEKKRTLRDATKKKLRMKSTCNDICNKLSPTENTLFSGDSVTTALCKSSTENGEHIHRIQTMSTISRQTCSLFGVGMKYITLELSSTIKDSIDDNGIFHYRQVLYKIFSLLRSELKIPSTITDQEIRENVVCTWSLYEYIQNEALSKPTAIGPCPNCFGGILIIKLYSTSQSYTVSCSLCDSKLHHNGSEFRPWYWSPINIMELLDYIDTMNGISKSIIVVKNVPEKGTCIETLSLVTEAIQHETKQNIYSTRSVDTTPTTLTTFLIPSKMGRNSATIPLILHHKKTSVIKTF